MKKGEAKRAREEVTEKKSKRRQNGKADVMLGEERWCSK
jgi:hypothetical protein